MHTFIYINIRVLIKYKWNQKLCVRKFKQGIKKFLNVLSENN